MEGFGGTKGDDDSDVPLTDEEEGLIVVGDETIAPDEAEEALDTVQGPPLSRVHSRVTPVVTPYGSPGTKRMSSPIGIRGGSVGPGGARRLSNGLGQTHSGHGAGGSSFT